MHIAWYKFIFSIGDICIHRRGRITDKWMPMNDIFFQYLMISTFDIRIQSEILIIKLILFNLQWTLPPYEITEYYHLKRKNKFHFLHKIKQLMSDCDYYPIAEIAGMQRKMNKCFADVKCEWDFAILEKNVSLWNKRWTTLVFSSLLL